MHGIILKVEIIASTSKVLRAVQARTKINTHTMTKTHIHINESALTIPCGCNALPSGSPHKGDYHSN